jgi:hypothetical protein
MCSTHGVFPICVDDDSAVAFVEVIHDMAISFLQDLDGVWDPQIYVSLMQGARNYVARTGSAAGVFRPDAQPQTHGKAKHFFPGFTIRF